MGRSNRLRLGVLSLAICCVVPFIAGASGCGGNPSITRQECIRKARQETKKGTVARAAAIELCRRKGK